MVHATPPLARLMLQTGIIMTKPSNPRRRILVVDDEELLRWSICTYLEEAGFEVLEGGTVADGLAAAVGPLDAALVDYRLPDGTGIDLAAALRRAFPDLRVVMMTAFRTSGLNALADGVGVDCIIDKPFVARRLVAILTEIVEGRAHTSECAS